MPVTMPVPPWERAARRRPIKQPLSREAIVEAALAILSTEGAGALTMRRVAQELDTGAASLYAHVTGKEELENLLFDRIAGEIPLPAPDPARWREQVKQLLSDTHDVYNRHPGAAAFAMARIPYGPNALDRTETLLGLLREGGISDQGAAFAADLLYLFVTAHAFEASVYQSQGKSEETMQEQYTQLRGYFESLPAQRFPNIVRLAAGPLFDFGDGDDRFAFGLDVLIAGLSALLPDPDRSPKPSAPAEHPDPDRGAVLG